MAKFRGSKEAFGKPGIDPRWSHGNKEGAGTAYSADSPVWFTLWNGVVTEVYYPTIDQPQIRDLQYLVSDGKTFMHEEKRNMVSSTERFADYALGYRIINTNHGHGYRIIKEVIVSPHLPCLVQRTWFEVEEDRLSDFSLYVLCAPHLECGGWGNNAYVVQTVGREILVAQKGETWLALAASVPFKKLSCGYVGRSDGWTDLNGDFKMDWEFDRATDGNVALTGEVPIESAPEFTVCLAFGNSLQRAISSLLQALGIPYDDHRTRYIQQWQRPCGKLVPLDSVAQDGGSLYHASYSLLMAHEDKAFPGAFIASLSIPWGEAKGDEDIGGYHLVWTRDMVNSATALLAAGNVKAPLRALIYLAASQQPDGGFPQNFWLDGRPYWTGIQLDEVAFPILLAWHLDRHNALEDFDPYPTMLASASFIMCHGPATQQERWEEASGYSPSTIAVNIAALICAAYMARRRGDEETATLIEDYADFLECHLEPWTVTTQGTLVPGISRHYIRILPVNINDPIPVEDPNRGLLELTNQPPGANSAFPAKDIVDAGFLELVRYGVRRPDDPLILDSLRVVDALLKVETPAGPCWHRYNNDGFGQRPDGGPYQGWGRGRAWPLLTGERGHYELAAGRDTGPFIQTMERLAYAHGLLPEQVWDEEDRPSAYLRKGGPTGAAMPLMWAHAEYIQLLRSTMDCQPFSRIPLVADRYQSPTRKCGNIEIWKPVRQPRKVKPGATLRIQTCFPFRLRWSKDEWATTEDTVSRPTCVAIHFADIPIPQAQKAPIRFTFFHSDTQQWECRDYEIAILPDL